MNSELVRVDTVSSPALVGANLCKTLRRQWIVAIALTTAVFVGTAFLTLRKVPRYQSETLILVNYNTSVPVLATPGSNDNSNNQDISTEIQILRSRPLVSRALEKLERQYKNISVDEVVGNLSITQADKAGILIVSYTDANPARVKAVLDVLGKTYVQYSSERQRSRATNAIRLIESQLPAARQSLNEASSALRTFRQNHGIVDPESYAATVLERSAALKTQLQETQAALNQSQTQYQALRRQMAQASQNPQTVVADAVLSQDQTYQKLVEQLQQVEAEYTQESVRFQDTHPKVQALQQRRQELLNLMQRQARLILGNKASQAASKNALSGSIQQDLANELLQVQTRLAVQSSQLDSIRQAQQQTDRLFQQIPYLEQNYVRLQEQFKLNSEAVNRFLEKLQELRITEAQETSPWRILEAPYLPTTPSSPNYQRNLLMGLIVSALLGIGAAILLERFDQTVKDLAEIKAITAVPILGALPKVNLRRFNSKNEKKLLSEYDRRSAFTESLRSTALVIQSLRSRNDIKTLAFTSAETAEGKTTVTYNLGLILADLGQKVLIIDADMHQPTMHELLEQPNAAGLSTALASDRPWHEIIHFGGVRKPDVMTAGPVCANPVALLVSENMKKLLAESRQAYDYVLLDTPPIIGLTEAQSIASDVDGIVLVVAMESSTRSAIAQAIELFSSIQGNLLGSIVNFLPSKKRVYSHSA